MRGNRTRGARSGDGFTRFVALQFAAAALLVAALFGVMRLSPALFRTFCAEFAALMEKDAAPEGLTFFPPLESASSETDPADETTTDETTTEEKTAEETTDGETETPTTKSADPTALSLRTAPVMPVSGTVTSDYGDRLHPIYGETRFHAGRDIAAAAGTPIRAALDGEAVAVGVGEMSGNYIRLDHGNGVETFYCHCSSVCAAVGDAVKKGDVIAYVGQTGLATGPHLHFEFRIDGNASDPGLLLDGAVCVD